MVPLEMNPCANVRRTCQSLMEEPSSKEGGYRTVSIDSSALQILAERISKDVVITGHSDDGTVSSAPEWAAWDSEGWHYTAKNFKGSVKEKKERIALYVLALDAINFCFWPNPTSSPSTNNNSNNNNNNSLEYDHLAIALKRVAEQDETSNNIDGDGKCESSYALSPQNLATATTETFLSLLQPHLNGHIIPNPQERVRLWNELGHGLLHFFNGQAMKLVVASGRYAPKLVWLLASTFPGFRDESINTSNGTWICFYKRAQIAVGDLSQALGEGNLSTNKHATDNNKINDDDNDDDLTCMWTGMEFVTTFADYRVPQLLRHTQVLTYDPLLEKQVDAQTEIFANSIDELSIRAATVVAVEKLVKEVKEILMSKKGTNHRILEKVTAVTMDWYLWQVGEKLQQQGQMKPHHKTRTIFY